MHWAVLAVSCATILAGINVGEAIPVVLGIAGIIIGLWLGGKGRLR